MRLGTDPELFLRDDRTGEVRSVVGLVGGTKANPLQMEGLDPGFAIQEDNVALEFNIPPANTMGQFSNNIGKALDYVRNMVMRINPDLVLDVGRCERLFSYNQLDNEAARMFGCSADYDAHSQGRRLPAPDTDELKDDGGEWRFTGGHMHIAYESSVPAYVAAAFGDVYWGLSSVAIDHQGRRRQLYGSAGRYRETPYGLEYRVLSNFWIWNENLRMSIGQRGTRLINLLEGPVDELQRLYAEIPWTDVADAINTENEVKAADLITYLSHDLGMTGL